MAAKYALLAYDTYQRLMSRKELSTMTEPPDKPNFHIYGLEESSEDPILSTLIDLLPRTLRGKGKVLMHYIHGKILLDEHSRVIYTVEMSDGSTSEETGSHILDLVKYAISPGIQFGNVEQASSSRPIDWPRFQQLLHVIGVPQSSLGKGKRLEAETPQMLPLRRKNSTTPFKRNHKRKPGSRR